jgi:hypothetical protein
MNGRREKASAMSAMSTTSATNATNRPAPANARWSSRLRAAIVGAAIVVAACAGYSGSNLRPGVSTADEVFASMGEPALRWREADGREQYAYPRGPLGWQTFMVYIGPDDRLERIEPVLNYEHFALIRHGASTQDEVLKLLGPPSEAPSYFRARDEIDWEWRVCDSWNSQAFFIVLFDAPSGIVRSTMMRPADEGFTRSPRGCSNSGPG